LDSGLHSSSLCCDQTLKRTCLWTICASELEGNERDEGSTSMQANLPLIEMARRTLLSVPKFCLKCLSHRPQESLPARLTPTMKTAGCPAAASGSTVFSPVSVSASVCGMTCAERLATTNSMSVSPRYLFETIPFLNNRANTKDTNYFIWTSSL
jgi:hypothetical protein